MKRWMKLMLWLLFFAVANGVINAITKYLLSIHPDYKAYGEPVQVIFYASMVLLASIAAFQEWMEHRIQTLPESPTEQIKWRRAGRDSIVIFWATLLIGCTGLFCGFFWILQTGQ